MVRVNAVKLEVWKNECGNCKKCHDRFEEALHCCEEKEVVNP